MICERARELLPSRATERATAKRDQDFAFKLGDSRGRTTVEQRLASEIAHARDCNGFAGVGDRAVTPTPVPVSECGEKGREPTCGSGGRYDWPDKVNPVDAGCHAVNRSQLTLKRGDAQGFGTSANQDRGPTVPLGGQGESQLHASTRFNGQARVEVDPRPGDVAKLRCVEFSGPFSRDTHLQGQVNLVSSCFSAFPHVIPQINSARWLPRKELRRY